MHLWNKPHDKVNISRQKQTCGFFSRWCEFGIVVAKMPVSPSSFINSPATIECCLDCKQAKSCLFWIANQTATCFHLCSPAAIIVTTYKIQIWGRKNLFHTVIRVQSNSMNTEVYFFGRVFRWVRQHGIVRLQCSNCHISPLIKHNAVFD